MCVRACVRACVCARGLVCAYACLRLCVRARLIVRGGGGGESGRGVGFMCVCACVCVGGGGGGETCLAQTWLAESMPCSSFASAASYRRLGATRPVEWQLQAHVRGTQGPRSPMHVDTVISLPCSHDSQWNSLYFAFDVLKHGVEVACGFPVAASIGTRGDGL